MSIKNELPPGWGEQSNDDNPWGNQQTETSVQPVLEPVQQEQAVSSFPSVTEVNMPNVSLPNIPKPKLPDFPKKTKQEPSGEFSSPIGLTKAETNTVDDSTDVAKEMSALFGEEVQVQPQVEPVHPVQSQEQSILQSMESPQPKRKANPLVMPLVVVIVLLMAVGGFFMVWVFFR